MCGICGIFSLRPAGAPLAQLPAMTAALAHRGPDDEGFAFFSAETPDYWLAGGSATPEAVYRAGQIYAPNATHSAPPPGAAHALGHRRLSILDLSPAGHQPFTDETGRYWLAYNGEVYNYAELRAELARLGRRFHTGTDTEVVLAAYREWGAGCAARFNGMWAILLWDNREKRLWVSRDRLGVKPLYVYRADAWLAFASEIKAFAPLVGLEPDLEECQAYLEDGADESLERTPFRRVTRFPPAHSAEYRFSPAALEAAPAPRAYWRLEAAPETARAAFAEDQCRDLAARYREILTDAVRLRLRADVKIGTALSGGLDSSTIACLVNGLLGREAAGQKQVTFSTVHSAPDARHCDESRYIDALCSHFDLVNHRIEPDRNTLIAEHRSLIRHMDTPPESTCLSGWFMFKLPRPAGVLVTLDGQGADEQLAGYRFHLKNYLYHRADPAARRQWVREGKLSRGWALGGPWAARLGLLAVLERLRPPDRRLPPRLREYLRARRAARPSWRDNLSQALNKDTLGGLKTLLHYSDRISMAQGIESRLPFVDYRLLDFLATVPDSCKLHAGWSKYLARRAFAADLPAEVVWRRDKLGWPQPEAAWLAGDFGRHARAALDQSRLLAEFGGAQNWRSAPPARLIRAFNLATWETVFFERN